MQERQGSTWTAAYTYSVDDELLSTSGGLTNTYTYNANGEQTGRVVGGVAYTLDYDYDGQLTGITSPSGSVDYAYDATGRRVSRTAGGTATQFVYGPGGILQERQGSTWTAAYTYGSALLRRNSEVPLYDALGSERTVTDGSGAVTGSIAYEAFGQPVATSGSSGSPYTFAATSGYRNDGDAGLTHVGARYYDAQVGRFITRDTELDQHPYLYCDHDPVNALDPSGHLPGWLRSVINIGEDVIIGVGVTVVGTVLLPVEAPVAAVIAVGVIGGAIAGGGIAGNDYYWDHPDPSTWDPGEFDYGVKRGAIVGGMTGGICAPPVTGALKPILSPRPPVIDPITDTWLWRLKDGGSLK